MGTNSKPTKPKVRHGLKHRGGGGGGGARTLMRYPCILHNGNELKKKKKTTKLQSDTAELLMNKTVTQRKAR